ncbi:hypothetical protein JZO66_06345 [Enterococcus sp. DIV0242_7C1]|uniref:Uncharacterized protein n=1 Tax=Candidatus Enterococcus dunnyi TaxID=1834192 RepID=A0AAQ3W3Q2_9ENTE|nr:hypothetical protein [Enterococcus sp. DIV0242_7C1]MBO0470157.1 hypothetical protein [Enterococcus sp. DIV0242_7C1]
MKKKLGFILGIILLVAFFVAGKKYMDRKAVEKSYQDGIELVQNHVTNYLVTNYEGIEKIEWQGVGVEWRSSDVFGSSILGNYVDSDVKVFVSADKFFTVDFTLAEKTEYNNELKKYVLEDSMNPTNIDSTIKTGLENAVGKFKRGDQLDKTDSEKMKKGSKGSPNAQVIYNLDIHELTY